jgi:hypothetical protein
MNLGAETVGLNLKLGLSNCFAQLRWNAVLASTAKIGENVVLVVRPVQMFDYG